MGREKPPGLLARFALKFEEEATKTSPISPRNGTTMSRRDLLLLPFKKARENVQKNLQPAAAITTLIGTACLGAYVLYRLSERNISINVSPDKERNLKTLPTGEKVLFFNPYSGFSLDVNLEKGVAKRQEPARTPPGEEIGRNNILIANFLDGYLLAVNVDGLSKSLSEQQVDLLKLMGTTFVIGVAEKPLPVDTKVVERGKIIAILFSEKNVSSTNNYQPKISRDLSALFLAWCHYLSHTGQNYWAMPNQLQNREQAKVNGKQQEILARMDSQTIPPVSVWKTMPESP